MPVLHVSKHCPNAQAASLATSCVKPPELPYWVPSPIGTQLLPLTRSDSPWSSSRILPCAINTPNSELLPLPRHGQRLGASIQVFMQTSPQQRVPSFPIPSCPLSLNTPHHMTAVYPQPVFSPDSQRQELVSFTVASPVPRIMPSAEKVLGNIC